MLVKSECSLMAPLCVCVCLCVSETKALQPGVWQE